MSPLGRHDRRAPPATTSLLPAGPGPGLPRPGYAWHHREAATLACCSPPGVDLQRAGHYRAAPLHGGAAPSVLPFHHQPSFCALGRSKADWPPAARWSSTRQPCVERCLAERLRSRPGRSGRAALATSPLTSRSFRGARCNEVAAPASSPKPRPFLGRPMAKPGRPGRYGSSWSGLVKARQRAVGGAGQQPAVAQNRPPRPGNAGPGPVPAGTRMLRVSESGSDSSPPSCPSGRAVCHRIFARRTDGAKVSAGSL